MRQVFWELHDSHLISRHHLLRLSQPQVMGSHPLMFTLSSAIPRSRIYLLTFLPVYRMPSLLLHGDADTSSGMVKGSFLRGSLGAAPIM